MAKIIQYACGMSNGFFIVEEGSVIAVDGGAIYGMEQVEKNCSDAGIDPKAIRLIIASHTHVDHTCNLGLLRDLSGAPIAIHAAGKDDMIRAEMPHVYARCTIGDEIFDFVAKQEGGMPDDYLPSITPDVVWENELDLKPYGIGGKVIHTPGHSLADGCVILDDGQAIVGDLICEDGFTHGKPTIAYFGYDPDRRKANEMLLPNMDRLADTGCVIFYAGHGGPFTREQFLTALEEAHKEAEM